MQDHVTTNGSKFSFISNVSNQMSLNSNEDKSNT